MNYRRLLRALVLFKHDEPTFDTDAIRWMRSHGMVETVTKDGMPADFFTPIGMHIYAHVEAYFTQHLDQQQSAGAFNGSEKRNHDTNQQKRRRATSEDETLEEFVEVATRIRRDRSKATAGNDRGNARGKGRKASQ